MQTRYELWYVTLKDDVHISKCTVRFCEGETTTKDEPNFLGVLYSVTKFRKSKELTKEDLAHLGNGFEKDSFGRDVKIYTDKDFGAITTVAELRAFVNGEIAKDLTRVVIKEQEVA